MPILALTTNAKKIAEYRKQFAEYSLDKAVKQGLPLEAGGFGEAEIAQWLREARERAKNQEAPLFAFREESDLYHAETGLAIPRDEATGRISAEYNWSPVYNRSTLVLYYLDDNGDLQSKNYQCEIPGHIKFNQSVAGSDIFDWDDVFVSSFTGKSYQETLDLWGKNSARNNVLAQVIIDKVKFNVGRAFNHGSISASGMVDLNHWKQNHTQPVDFQNSVQAFVRGNHVINNPHINDWGLGSLISHAIAGGVHFRSTSNRREWLYWAPGYNAGIPLTPKEDPYAELVYMVHDFTHYATPDLAFDGKDTPEGRTVYIFHRMMGECMAMVMADMVFMDSMVKSGIERLDHQGHGIYPVFQSLEFDKTLNKKEQVTQLLWAAVSSLLLGDDEPYIQLMRKGADGKTDPAALEKFEKFKAKYKKFALADFDWTDKNYANMSANARHFSDWVKIVGEGQFNEAGLHLLSSYTEKVRARGVNMGSFASIASGVFDKIMEGAILPKLEKHATEVSDEEATSRAFRRYVIGQMTMFSKYKNVEGVEAAGREIMEALRNTRQFSQENIGEIRGYYNSIINKLAVSGVINDDDKKLFRQVHPMVSASFVSYSRPRFLEIPEMHNNLFNAQAERGLPLPKTVARNVAVVESVRENVVVAKTSPYVRKINGVTYINTEALWASIGDKSQVPAKDRLRQLMINAGVGFFDSEQTIVAKPVVGIRTIGGFPVVFDENTPEGRIAFSFAPDVSFAPEELVKSLKNGMGLNAMDTYMNPKGQTPEAMYDINVGHHGVPSVAHAASLGYYMLGLSMKAEMEFDTQRDIVHLARLTSARTPAQDMPALVAMSGDEEVVAALTKLRNQTQVILDGLHKPKNMSDKDWREERNSMWPKNSAMSLGVNGTVKNLAKLVAAIGDEGKELEYRNLLAQINDSLHGLLPELFKTSVEMGHQYPKHWNLAVRAEAPASQIEGSKADAISITVKQQIAV